MPPQREEPCAPAPAPASMAAALTGYAWARDTVGQSGAAVYRLHGKPGAADLFLKHGLADLADAICDEMLRLRWLAAWVPVPEILHFTRSAGEAWLLTTALPGHTAYQVLSTAPHRRHAVVDALAHFLRRIHAIPVGACPFTSDHADRLRSARARMDAGLVDEDDFDEERAGWTTAQAWEAMQALLPLTPDAVVTHGDFSLDNLFIHDGDVIGCIDSGRLGIADRYQDLAIAWNCLGEFGAALQQRFLDQYGLIETDDRKLQFHLILDEFF